MYTKNIVHARSEVCTKPVKTYGLGLNLWLWLELMTRVKTYDVSQNLWAMCEAHMTAQPFGLMSELMTCVGVAGARARAILHVRISDTCHNFWHHKSAKNIFCAREVLECLSCALVIMLEHSILLRPTKFASLFIVRHILNSRSKEYNHFNHLNLQCLHMTLFLSITS